MFFANYLKTTENQSIIRIVTKKAGDNTMQNRTWKRSDGETISDTGANTVPNRFDGAEKARNHYIRHGNDYPGLTQAQYVDKAADLATQAAGGDIIGFSTDDGCVVRYDRSTKDFVKAYPGSNGYVKTFYKPKGGDAYFHDEKKNTWKYRKGKR
jgi:pyocin large subunit-like protein